VLMAALKDDLKDVEKAALWVVDWDVMMVG
jgi:hypothetical protein